ncbi:tautomerase family protein [Allobaculum stercoricanis]|uniref:tautomerase family protein n=1 Tax=Allobaculum stercoricanis TaxID=174709 RepID=UPI000361F8DB|nr:tautomerase family protein [Allobaculum stercoricanis]
MDSNWDKKMPHLKVQMYPGRTDAQKEQLAKSLEECMKEVLGSPSSSISIAIEEIPQENWHEEVVEKELKENSNTVVKMPGYPLDK